jgi:geranylgeranyl diphosphate synthase, type I
VSDSPGSLPPVLARHRDAIEQALQAALHGADSPLVPPGRYVMGWETLDGGSAVTGGKRIRPALTVAAAEVFGGTLADALPGAVAIELIHNFSLVHDEIQDQDDVRHGRPTAYTVWGPGQAINLGDFLYSRAIRALTGGEGDVTRRMAALEVLMKAIEGMIAGQWRDISFEQRDTVTVDEYLEMVEGKTGVLLGAALQMGAILGGASPTHSAVIGQWGVKLGLAFQAIDDYLGIWGDAAVTGKTTSGDIARKKKTLPIVHALGDLGTGAIIRSIFAADRQIEEHDRIAAAIEWAGGAKICKEVARKYADEADVLLASIVLGDEAAALRSVGEYFVDRSF